MAEKSETQPPVTQCLICHEEFMHPRVLNCIHTFCLDCLIEYGREEGKQPGQGFPCPVCRKEHVIPDGGMEDLPRNIFMEHLLEMLRLEKTDHKNIMCQVCDLEEDVPSHALGTNQATTYCLDCRQYHCTRCSKHHTKQRFSQGHEMVSLGRKISADMIKRVKTYCDQHKDKQVEFYCYDCRITFCMSCYVVRHNTHRSCDIAEISAQFYRDVEEDIGRVVKITGECLKEADDLKKLQLKFLHDVETTEERVKLDADKLRRFVDDQERSLLGDLEEIKDLNMERIRLRMHDINRHIEMLNNFRQYIMEVKEKATPADVSRIGVSLHERANELHAIPYDVDFVLDAIQYMPDNFPQTVDKQQNLIGRVSVLPQWVEGKGQQSHDPTNGDPGVGNADESLVTQPQPGTSSATEPVIKEEVLDVEFDAMPSSQLSINQNSKSLLKVVKSVLRGAEILGITALEEEIYVVRKYPNVASAVAPVINVEAYDMKTFTPSRQIVVPDLQDPRDMTSCAQHSCLYVSDAALCCIFTIQPIHDKQKKWPVCDQPDSLSVNRAHNLLVTCTQSSLVKEYRTDGTLIREISFARHGLTAPIHVVQLESGLLVVCHSGRGLSRGCQVCVTDIDGAVMESFSGTDSLKSNMNFCPTYMIVYRDEFVFVADSGNHQVLPLQAPTLNHGGPVLSKLSGLRNPFRLLLVRDVLYVVDNFQYEGQVLVCS